MDLIPCRFPFCIDRETSCFAECTAYLAATARDVIPQIPSDAKRRKEAKKRAAELAKTDDQSAEKTGNSPGVAT